ncbi:MAG: Rnase Y domain-containing protein, partial [Deltaproteobacteria bacterium]
MNKKEVGSIQLAAIITGVVVFLVTSVIFFWFGIVYRKKLAETKIGSAESEASKIIEEAKKNAEGERREALLQAKEDIHRNRVELDKEIKERRNEILRLERRLVQKEETLDKKVETLEQREEGLNKRDKEIQSQMEEVAKVKKNQLEELERISGLSTEDAKEYLLKNLENEVKHEAAIMIKDIETKAKDEADSKAREIIVSSIQKCAADHASEATVSVVPLPNDEMKGRIIGREGRNIRTLETLTGI